VKIRLVTLGSQIHLCALGPTPAGSSERLIPFAVHVPTATVAVGTGIRKRAVCSVVDEAMAPITTGPTTKPAQPQPAIAATALQVFTLFTAPAAVLAPAMGRDAEDDLADLTGGWPLGLAGPRPAVLEAGEEPLGQFGAAREIEGVDAGRQLAQTANWRICD